MCPLTFIVLFLFKKNIKMYTVIPNRVADIHLPVL